MKGQGIGQGKGKGRGQANGARKGTGRDKGRPRDKRRDEERDREGTRERTREGKNGGPLVLLYCKYDTKCHNTNFMSYFYPVAKILISNTSSNQTQILYKPLLNGQHVAEIKDRTHSHLVGHSAVLFFLTTNAGRQMIFIQRAPYME